MAALAAAAMASPTSSWRQAAGPHRARAQLPRAPLTAVRIADRRRVTAMAAPKHKVEIRDLDGSIHLLEVPEDRTILDVAIDKGLKVSYDCKLGVCMTCPAKLMSGTVDQSNGMLSPDVQEKGYALLCCAFPRTDIKIQIVEEDELLNEQLVA